MLTFKRLVNLLSEPFERVLSPFAVDERHVDIENA
jgi:hypothetical protein